MRLKVLMARQGKAAVDYLGPMCQTTGGTNIQTQTHPHTRHLQRNSTA